MSRKWKTLLLYLALSSPTANAFDFGLNPQTFRIGAAAAQPGILESGASIIRAGRHGNLQAENAIITWARTKGIKVLMFCGYKRDIPDFPSPAAFDKYAEMCLADVQNLDPGGGTITHVEVWNEWNGGIGLGCTHGNPPCNDGAMYASLLARVYDKFFAASRLDIKIVGGATAGMDLNFLERMLDAGAANKMDLFSWHFYLKPNTSCSNPTTATPQNAANRFLECVGKIRDAFTSRGLTPKPQIITEWGRRDDGTTASMQLSADTIGLVYAAARSNPLIAGMLWFQLSDNPNELGFGLYDRGMVPKPQLAAFKAAGNVTQPLAVPINLRIID